jgi:hypothetical protein
MTEYDKSQSSVQGGGGAGVAVDVMEVLMRGLETARRDIEAQDEGEAGLFCGFAYGSPGTFCPFAYWHSESLAEKSP